MGGYGFQTDSIIYVDPRTKMILLALCSVAALREPRLLFQTLIFALAYILMLNGRLFKSANKYLAVYLIMYGIHVYISAGEGMNGIKALFAGILIFRMFIPVMMIFTVMIRTTRVSEFLAAFDKMHMPKEITIPFSVMFRFFPTIGEEWDNIRNAMRFRGFSFSIKNVITRPAFLYECAIVPLLSDTVMIADELSAASLCRGLGADGIRTCCTEIKMGITDYLLILVAIGLNIVSLFAY